MGTQRGVAAHREGEAGCYTEYIRVPDRLSAVPTHTSHPNAGRVNARLLCLMRCPTRTQPTPPADVLVRATCVKSRCPASSPCERTRRVKGLLDVCTSGVAEGGW